jgi:hypothetical protein
LRRHTVVSLALASMCILTVYVILDLDRPHGGFIQLNRTGLLDLRLQMGKAGAAASE